MKELSELLTGRIHGRAEQSHQPVTCVCSEGFRIHSPVPVPVRNVQHLGITGMIPTLIFQIMLGACGGIDYHQEFVPGPENSFQPSLIQEVILYNDIIRHLFFLFCGQVPENSL